VNIRQQILKRLTQLEWSNYRLVESVKGKVPASTVYGFLRGEHPINSDHLGHLLDALGLKLTASKAARR
jgi:hypothetical protein